MAPFDVMDHGRMSFVLDPSGAAVALWQAGEHIGATLVNEPAETGGTVVVPPFDIPVGRIAVLSDPQGAMFSVIKMAPGPAS